jgi:hypothetical protein
MNKVFIVGAGLSKALADAPLANELFELIYQQALTHDTKESRMRRRDRGSFREVINHLQRQRKPQLDFLQQDGTKIKACDKFPNFHPIDIEYLCTILDLNIEHAFIPEGVDVDLQGCPIPYMQGFTEQHLTEARRFIRHYILKLLLPGNGKLKPKIQLINKLISKMKPGDTVITFNYDILLEQALWKEGIWNPLHGYGIKVDKRRDENFDVSDFKDSKVSVFKLHGSVNWHAVNGSEDRVEVYTTHPFTNEPLFDGLNVKSTRVIPERKYSLTSHIVLPTILKASRHRWEIEMIKNASQAISEAKEVFILGYSFREADAMANYIFTQIPCNSQIRIVDLHIAEKLAQRLSQQFGISNQNIIYEKNSIEEWINNDFKYIAFEKKLEQDKTSNEAFGI